jgi:hypothetical protein
MESALKTLPANRALCLSNRTCLYCGAEPTADSPHTVEHVVGRRFVPKGSLHQSWALIGKACAICNGEKAGLEDDISAITLQPNLGERHRDPVLQAEAVRKSANSISRRTKKRVAESHEEDSVSGTIMSSLDFTANFIMPPQFDQKRVHRLAEFHLQGFFYLMSYDESGGIGGFLPGPIGFAANANRPDWGNEHLRGFADQTEDWSLQLDCVCASGFFKIRMRRETEQSALWAFALEWNQMHRVVGYFGDLERAQGYFDALPPLKWKALKPDTRYRQEIALAPEEDTLFAVRAAP